MRTGRFYYLADPLSLCAGTAYALNRCLLKRALLLPFLKNHFNDLLLIPAALPLLLWIQRRLLLRNHDEFPSAAEIFFHLVIWSVACEWIGPRWLHLGTADPFDVLCYLVGGLLSWLWWHRQTSRQAPRSTRSTEHSQ